MAKVANLKSNIQSTIQQSINEKQKQIASSSAAAKAGSTETPTVTATPKVTQTAKAVPSLKPEITPVSISTTPTPTVNARDLLGSKTTPTLRKAAPDLLSKSVEKKDVVSDVIPGNIIASADSIGGSAKETVDKTLMQQFSDWFKETPQKVTQKVGSLFKEPVEAFGTNFEKMFSDTEYWIAGLADVIETSVGGKGGFQKAFQEQQGWFWDEYGEELDIEASKAYDEDMKSQKLSNDVSDWLWIRTGNKEASDMIGGVVGRVASSLKDPKQVAGVVGYMTPALILQAATGGGFLTNTAIWLPSQSANVYKDLSQDNELTSKYTDNQLFGISTGIGTLLSMVETFGDALGDMPWAKAMSRDIRNVFTKSLRKEVTKGLSKEITDVVDKNLINDIKKPILNALKKWYFGSFGEGVEEVVQDTIQTEGARALGSKREGMSLEQMLTTFFTAQGMGLIIQTPGAAFNIKQNSDLKKQYDEFSKTVDKLAPGINEDTKQAFFSAMITSQQNDANLSNRKIEKYEAQTTQLYNQISELEQQLESTTDENAKTSIKDRISSLNNQIKEIDSKINQWNNTREEINKYLEEYNQDIEIEEKIAQKETQLPREEGGENLSAQTMSDSSVIDSTPVDEMTNDEILDGRNYRINNKPATPQERKRQKDLENEMNIRMNNQTLSPEIKKSLEELTFDVNNMSIWDAKAILKELDMLKQISYDKAEFSKGDKYVLAKREVRKKFNELLKEDREEAKTEKRDNESLLPETKIDDKDFFGKMSGIYNLDKYAVKIFNLDRKHIPGLKSVKISGIEDLSESEIMEIANNAATVAGILGIDFNKILNLDNVQFSVLDLKGEDVKGQTEDISGRLYLEAGRGIGAELLKMAIILKDTGPSTFGHELMHFLDKQYLYRSGKLWTKGDNLSRSSLLKDSSFKTYNLPYLGYKMDDNYWDSSREILARFAEQYIAKQIDERQYNSLKGDDFYWSDKEFNKLVPKFERLLSYFSEFKLDKGDKINYPEIMKKIAEVQYMQTQFSLGEEMDMYNRLLEMKEEYDQIISDIEKIEDDTLKIELQSAASTLYSNYEMLNKMKEDYLKMQQTTPEQQKDVDTITTEVVPNPPQDPEIIKNGLPQLGGSNIENGIADIIQGKSPDPAFLKTYMSEQDKIKIKNRKKKFVGFFKELHQVVKDVFTPAITRAYNISPRVAGRLITMETQKDINIHRYRKQAEGFVKTLGGLKGQQALEVKMALLDYGALASEQGEDIEQYKKEEVAKLKEVLLRNGFKEKDINDMFGVLNDIGQQYKDAGLSIVLTDMYFPRVVKDYEGLIDYMNRVSDKDIKLNKTSLMIRIREIQADDKLNDAEKEARIRRAISMEFNQPGTTSQHGKERKMGKLSDWGPGIYAYYESPIESIDHYITTMVNAIERQLFLGGLKEDANLDADIINQDTAESVSQIIGKLVESGQISEDDVAELQKSIMAVLNKKPSPKSVTAIKDVTYIATITNFISAANQLDDLGMVILKDKSGLKHIVKAIFGKANIKYDDLGLEDAYEMFREGLGITNWLFKKSFFNAFDRLGKTSFINAAWESMIHQSKNPKTRQYLYSRLQAMYGTESANRMMEKIDSGNYNDETGQIDIEILRDLLYQLGSTQPLYTSAMPVTYLNHPWARLAYALSSFTLKRMDWLFQGAKEVYQRNGGGAKGATAAGAWIMAVSSFLAMFGAAIGDIGDFLKGKKEETFLWNFINNGIEEALAAGFSDAADSWLKIWDLSEYDLKTYKQQGMEGLFMSKISPFIFDLGKDVKEAIFEHDKDEITDLAKYVPIFGKLLYYNLWADIGKSTKGEFNLDNLDVDLDLDLDNIELDLDDIELDLSDFELNL